MPRQITLAEKMGALAVVDELRHQQMVVNELMNLPGRRAEIARRIRDYYQSKGISCDDELVDEGVKRYFERRLAYVPPRLGRFERMFAGWVVNKRSMLKRSGKFLAGALVLAGAVELGSVGYQALSTGIVRSEAQDATRGLLSLEKEHGRQVALLQQFADSTASCAACEDIRVKVALHHGEYRELAQNDLKQKIEMGDLTKLESYLQELKPHFAKAKTELWLAKDLLEKLDGLSSAASVVQRVEQHASFQLTRAESQRFREAYEAAKAGLVSGTTTPEQAIKAEELLLQETRLVSLDEHMRPVLASLARLEEQGFDSKRIIYHFTAPYELALQQGEYQSLKLAADDLRTLERFAETELTLEVVRNGRIGVEQNHRDHYLIVESLSPFGEKVPAPVLVPGSSRYEMQANFGIQVSKDLYNAVRQEVQDKRLVLNPVMATKPAGSLVWIYDDRVGNDRPNVITRW